MKRVLPTSLRAFGCSAALASVCCTNALVSREARAVEPAGGKRHFIQATSHVGAAWLGGDVEDQYRTSGSYAGLGIGYSYASRGIDFGAAFDYLALPHPNLPRRVFTPAVTMRFHLPMSSSTEFGLGLRAGWSWLSRLSVRDDAGELRDHTFSGLHLGLMPHVSLWLSSLASLDLGIELLVAGGGDSVGNQAKATYVQRRAQLGAVGGFLRGNFGL